MKISRMLTFPTLGNIAFEAHSMFAHFNVEGSGLIGCIELSFKTEDLQRFAKGEIQVIERENARLSLVKTGWDLAVIPWVLYHKDEVVIYIDAVQVLELKEQIRDAQGFFRVVKESERDF